jgi:hypothetical protein
MKEKKILIALLTVIAFAVTFFTAFAVLKYNESIDEEIEVAELDSVYISQDSTVAQLETPLAEEIEIEEKTNPTKTGELAINESRKILNFEDELSEEEISQLEDEYDVEFTDDTSVKGTYSVVVKETSDLDALSKDEKVSGIETDVPVKMFVDTVDWGIVRIGADKVWESGTGTGVKVAIIDTGIQTTHPDLSANITGGYDFVNNDTSAMDDNGHGTHVAGIVASTMNGTGNVGASYSAQLMPIKVLNESGYGYLSDVAKGVYYAADNGAKVINLSLGTEYDSDTLRNAIQYAASKGVIITAAAGNNYGAPCAYPAAYSSVICVVATDQYNKLASFSNVGGELAAPGVLNYSTYINNGYAKLSGTSMASPHIAGSAAVVMSACTDCSTSDVRQLLRNTAIDLGTTDYDIIFGYGLVNLVDAINQISPVEEEPEENIDEEQPLEDGGDEEKLQEEENVNKPDVEEKQEPDKPVQEEVYLDITSPITNASNRYFVRTAEDILLEFRVTPSTTAVSSYKIFLNNEEVEDYDGNSTSYTFDIEEMESIQYPLRVEANLDDGTKLTDSILMDLTKLSKGKSVRGISDFRNWFVRLFFN